jgi:twitching motility two-component system response regulator PilG
LNQIKQESESPPGNRLVMVIDDSPTLRALVQTNLARQGIETQGFSNGVAAIQWLSVQGERIPSVILLDINLPKLDGYEVVRLLRARFQHSQPIILLFSGRDGVLDHLKGKLVGANGYLIKPCSIQTIVATIQSALQ